MLKHNHLDYFIEQDNEVTSNVINWLEKQNADLKHQLHNERRTSNALAFIMGILIVISFILLAMGISHV